MRISPTFLREKKGKAKDMRGRLRKLLSFVLVLVLVVQMLPVSAFAEGVILAEGSAPTLAQRPDPPRQHILQRTDRRI